MDKNKDIVYSSFKLTAVGLEPVGTPSYEQWQAVGEFLKKSEGAVHFWLGDWLNYGETVWGEAHSQELEDKYGYDYNTLAKDRWVAKKIEPGRRHPHLAFRYHEDVAAMKPEEQDQLLAKAELDGIDTEDFRKVIKKYKHDKLKVERELMGEVEQNYEVIYADVRYLSEPKTITTPTLVPTEIFTCKFPLADDCTLFLWSTGENLDKALRVMEAWGFKYEDVLVWNKKLVHNSPFSQANVLFLLVGVHGVMAIPACETPLSVFTRNIPLPLSATRMASFL